MTIDTSKIKVGDKITVELTVVSGLREHSSFGAILYADRGYPFTSMDICISPDCIVGHTPQPWEPEVGDVIRSITHSSWSGKILYIDSEGDWLITSHSTKKYVILKQYQSYYELDPSS